MITSGPDSKLGQLDEKGSRIKQKFLELHQDRMEEIRLDYLALEIVEQRKKVAACQL